MAMFAIPEKQSLLFIQESCMFTEGVDVYLFLRETWRLSEKPNPLRNAEVMQRLYVQ